MCVLLPFGGLCLIRFMYVVLCVFVVGVCLPCCCYSERFVCLWLLW